MQKYVLLFIALFICKLSSAQNFWETNGFIGNWKMAKIEISESTINKNNIESPVVKVYRAQEINNQQTLMKNTIFSFEVVSEPNEFVLIEMPNNVFKNPIIEMPTPHSIMIYYADNKDESYSYNFQFINENELQLTTQDIFYTNNKGVFIKGTLSIYLKK